MELYRGSGKEVLSSDPSPERTRPEAETGLVEGTWPLHLEDERLCPELPTEVNCFYYLKTGFCGYGAVCQFNHPPRRDPVMRAARTGAVDYIPPRGHTLCQYYMRTGTCKFGVFCKFNHPTQGSVSTALVSLNSCGYPLRPGEKDCPFYMKTRWCKFGATCKFNHPQPADIPVSMPFPVQHPDPTPASFVGPVHPPSVHSSQQYGAMVTGSSLLPSYVPDPSSHVLVSPGMIYYPGWSPYQATVSSAASPTVQPTTWPSSFYGTVQFSPSVSSSSGLYQPPLSSLAASSGSPEEQSYPHGLYQPPLSSLAASSGSPEEQSYPQRRGQPECQHYMKTGDCKFGSKCRHHHPIYPNIQESNIILSSMGLPLRPGSEICLHFQQHGNCKDGRLCKFDHPMSELSYSPSASSLCDMPVVPYPVNSSLGTLAPSSSSSDLRPEGTSGLTKRGSVSSRSPLPPSTSASNASVSYILSRDEPIQDLSEENINPSAISKSI
ncbi:hypothetical protein SAY87_010854 [Trapa incisa]|uniref:C3H1-type domain-containing protein n=1 Tax=Trapa incisa TaxID=236973 RepID=A0AAN7GR28_9MYRT|nr:hypothetical protein SAY87_010854 [Trapa incisa]